MPKADAASSVTGALFEEGWSRIRGGPGSGSRGPQMVRAARGHRAAVFKAIRAGGCHTRAQLTNQLEYLTTKSSHIVDSRGVLDGKATLTGEEIASVADRFMRRCSDGFHPKLGQTTHMLMSFPVGTKGEDVRDIASEVCERFFSNDERHFDYLIAVHEDRAHPHAHVVLNRKSQEGEFFYLGRDHHFNYDDFRIGMVEAAEWHGVRLEATRRVERGVLAYAPRVREVYAAREEGREAAGRERVGRDLERATAEVIELSEVYRSMGADAATEKREGVATALVRAGELLARGERLAPEGGVYEAKVEVAQPEAESAGPETELRTKLAAAERKIGNAPEAERPGLQRELYDICANVARLRPLGDRSAGLTEPPSATGVYAEPNINRDRIGRLREPEGRTRIEAALEGSGLSAATVIARLEAGASSAALEDLWRDEDRKRIAAQAGLDPRRGKDWGAMFAKVRETYDRLADALTQAGVWRTGEIAETAAIRAPERVQEAIPGPERLERARDVSGAATGAERAVEGAGQDLHPEIARVVALGREDSTLRPFVGEADGARFRELIEDHLDAHQFDALLEGDADALDGLLADRMDRLYAVKAYLQSDPATEHGAAVDRIVEEIVDREIDAQRLAHGTGERRGLTH